MPPAVRTFLQFLSAACILLALASIVVAAPSYWQQYRILKTWPAVDAIVVNRAIVPFADERGGALYAGQLTFGYRVHGRDYVGVYQFPHLSTHAERKQKQLAPFPVGSNHSVRYHPADPSDIRIQAGYNVHFFVVPVFTTGVGLIFAALAAIFYGLSGLRRPANRLN